MLRALLALALVAVATPARAEGPLAFLGGGFYSRFVADDVGIGFELSVHGYPRKFSDEMLGIGGFVQIEAAGITDDTPHARVTFGGQLAKVIMTKQLGFGVGFELGGYVEDANDTYAGAVGFHVAPFVSAMGILSLSLTVDAPGGTFGTGLTRGVSVGLALALKVPLPLRGGF